jgi:hypothetical protein
MRAIEKQMPCGKRLILRSYDGRGNNNLPISVCGTMCEMSHKIPVYGFGSSSGEAVHHVLEIAEKQCNSCPENERGFDL